MRNFVHPGDDLDLIAPAGGVVSGNAYVIGAFFVIASGTTAAGAMFTGRRTGVFLLPSETGVAWAQGDVLYWDATNMRLTKTAAGNTAVGASEGVKASAAASGNVVLVPRLPI